MKTTKTLITEIIVYAAFLLVALFAFTFSSSAQQVKQTSDGNYIAVKTVRTDSVKVIETGHFFVDLNGNKLPVYQSKNGKLYVIRISRNTQKPYKYYLPLQTN